MSRALKSIPFIEYTKEDLSVYPSAESKGFIDEDNDFLVGASGGFLMNMNFIFMNTRVYREAAIHFEQHKVYSFAHEGSKEYTEFWREETKRRKYGMTANCKLYKKDMEEYFDPATTQYRREQLLYPLRITGDHYSFLNYGRILKDKTQEELEADKKANKGKSPRKKTGFPDFLDGQYWSYKMEEFAFNNGFNTCKAKARRKGFSYMRGNAAANIVNINRDVTVVFAAYDIKYLTDPGATTDMAKRNLDWFETHTPWKRGYLSEDYSEIELGYKKRREGNKKFGFRSKLISVSCRNNESAVIGKDGFSIDFEESGKFPNLQEVLNVTISATESGDLTTGMINLYGTGGTKDANWAAFSKAFYNCHLNNMIPMENVWSIDSRHSVCGFFYPQVWGYAPYIDEHGNSMLDEAFEADYRRKKAAEERLKISDLIIFIAQRANTPDEAFLNTKDNIFASIELTNHVNRVRHDDDYKFYKDGTLVYNDKSLVTFIPNQELISQGRLQEVHPYIEDVPFKPNSDIQGCIRMFFNRHVDPATGKVPDNLYYITYDPYGIDKKLKLVNTKNSLATFTVWTYPTDILGVIGDVPVAKFAGRRELMAQLDELVMKACEYWNAEVLAEVNRGEILSNFRKWKVMNRLMKDPTSVIDKKQNENYSADYGIVIGDSDKKLLALSYYRDYLYTVRHINKEGEKKLNLHYEYDLPTLLEISNFNLEDNFDRVSNHILKEFAKKAHVIKKHRRSNNNNSQGRARLSQLMKSYI
jgi:hypothetical protein